MSDSVALLPNPFAETASTPAEPAANPFDQFDAPGAKSAGNPFDRFDAPINHDSLVDAAKQGFAQEATKPLDPEAVRALRDIGIFNDYAKGQNSIVRTFNEALADHVLAPLFWRLPMGIYGAVRGMAEAPPPSDLQGRLLQGASGIATGLMEAFPRGFEAEGIVPHVGEPAAAEPAYRAPTADDLAAQRLSPETAPTVARPVSPEPFGPEQTGPEAQAAPEAPPAPDLHAIARQIAPETFNEFDTLAARKDTLRGFLDDLAKQRERGSSPDIARLDGQIDALREQRLTAPPSDRAEMANRITALEDQRAELADALPKEGDTPEMARVRRDMQETDYRMRDLAPDVSAAYRRAAAGEGPAVPETPPAETASTVEPTAVEPAPVAAETAPVSEAPPEAAAPTTANNRQQPPETPVAAAEPPPVTETPAATPAPPERAAARPIEGGIAGDVARQLVAAGRPAEEADAAGALVQAHYEARAARFNGAKGSAEDLYRAEAPDIVRGRQRVPEMAQAGELEQPRRGAIRLATDDARATITLFRDADASTVIHETGHHWLDELTRDAADPRAPGDLIADARTVRDYLGVEDGAEIPRKAHEKFARSFERYMMEGHAPSTGLARVFEQFKNWLTDIYQRVTRLRAPINDDIRAVFGRMLATPGEKPVIAPEALHEPPEFISYVHEAPKTGDGAFVKVPREPLRLVDWLKKNGGLSDDTFSSRVNTARGRADARANPTDIRQIADHPRAKGLIKAKTGMAHDDAAHAAWEAGYFPDHSERPSIDDLYAAIQEDLNGTPRYSEHDSAAVEAFREAVDRNSEIDRIAARIGINPRDYTPEQFFDLLTEHMSLEERARLVGSLDAEIERQLAEAEDRAKQFIESRGDAWEPDAVYDGAPATLEDLEREDERQRTAAAQSREGESGAEPSGPAGRGEDALQAGDGQGGPGARPASRGSARAGQDPEDPAADFKPTDSRLVDKAGNIRLDNIDTPEDFKQAIRDSAERNGDFLGRRRGVVSDKQRDALADVLGTTPDKVLTRQIGEAFNDSEIKMLERALAQSSQHVNEFGAKFAATGAEADDIAFTQALLRHDMIQGIYSQATAEAGRSLRALRRTQAYWSTEAAATEKSLRNLLDDATGRTFNQRLALAQKISTLNQAGQVSRLVRDALNPGLFDWIQSAYINALLSGPFTHLGYTAAGEMFGLFRSTAEAGTSAGVGAVRRLFGADARDMAHIGEIRAQLYGQMRGSWRGMKAGVEAIKTNQTVLPPETMTTAAGNAGAIGSRQIIPGPVGTVLEAPSRLVAALHSFNWTTFYEQAKAAEAYRLAVKEGLAGDALRARVAVLVDNPSEAIIHAASEQAASGALMQRPAYNSVMGTVSRLTNAGFHLPDMPLPGGGSMPLGTLRPFKYIDPFVQIQANVQKVAFGRATPLALISKEVRDDLMMRNGGAAFDRTAGRIIAGTTFMTAAGGLYFAGKMNNSGPTDPREATLWRRIHGMPHGLNVGGLSFDMMRLGNLGLQMSVAADLAHAIDRIGKDDAETVAAHLVLSFARNILDESFARGPKDLMEAVDDPDRHGGKWIRNFVTSAMPYSVGLGQVAREIDPDVRHARTLTDAFKAKLPYLSQEVSPLFDTWGQPVPSRGWAGTYYEHLLNDPVDRKLESLGITPSQASRHVNNIELTDQQYNDYARIGGRYARMRVEQFLNHPGVNQMPPEAQIGVINHLIEGARRQAAGMVTVQSLGTADDIAAKRKAVQDAAVRGASHEEVKKLRKAQ